MGKEHKLYRVNRKIADRISVNQTIIFLLRYNNCSEPGNKKDWQNQMSVFKLNFAKKKLGLFSDSSCSVEAKTRHGSQQQQ